MVILVSPFPFLKGRSPWRLINGGGLLSILRSTYKLLTSPGMIQADREAMAWICLFDAWNKFLKIFSQMVVNNDGFSRADP